VAPSPERNIREKGGRGRGGEKKEEKGISILIKTPSSPNTIRALAPNGTSFAEKERGGKKKKGGGGKTSFDSVFVTNYV